MKKIRNKIFETNSSSTHSFTIEKNNRNIKIDSEIKPDWDCEFGWEFETWNKPEEKLAYILRCLASYDYLYDANHNWENDEKLINAKLEEILMPFQKRMKNLGINFETPTNEDMQRGYVGSSRLDTIEFGILLDNLIEECKLQGIQTMTPEELSKLRSSEMKV